MATQKKPIKSLEQSYSLGDLGYKIRNKDEQLTSREVLAIESYIEGMGFLGFREFSQFLGDMTNKYNVNGPRHEKIKIYDQVEHIFTGDLNREHLMLIQDIYSVSNYKLKNGSKRSNYEKLFEIVKDKLLGCINFNYDLFAERALQEVIGNCREKIAYMHGCLSWREIPGGGILCKEDSEVTPDFSREHYYEQPGIICPTMVKEILARALQNPLEEKDQLIRHQWDLARSWLSRARTIFFIGYGFPEADIHAKDFFEQNLEKDNHVVFVCVGGNDNEDKAYKAYKKKLEPVSLLFKNFTNKGFEKFLDE